MKSVSIRLYISYLVQQYDLKVTKNLKLSKNPFFESSRRLSSFMMHHFKGKSLQLAAPTQSPAPHWVRKSVTEFRFGTWLLKGKNQEANVRKKGRCCNQKTWKYGGKVGSCPETTSKDSAQPWQFLKREKKGGRISVNPWGRRLDSASFSIVCRLADSLQTLSWGWRASLSFLEKNQQGRQGKVCILESKSGVGLNCSVHSFL